ncbi:MAG: hypothetical protein ACRCT8_13020 [Lacipirellulaceae bacterium]
MSGAPRTHAPEAAERARLRWGVYTLLIALALGQAAGKILAVNAVNLAALETHRTDAALKQERERFAKEGLRGKALDERVELERTRVTEELRLQRPFISGNDRSRWMAVRAIVEDGAYEIDRFLDEPTWDTLDMVQHRGRDGELHQYSSKPPLLVVLLAVPYWLVVNFTGMTLGTHPYEVGRLMLLLVNGGALLAMLVSVARLVERLGSEDFGRVLAVATAALGTLLASFTPALNNHLIAAAFVAVACDLWGTLATSDHRRVLVSTACGLAAGLAVACELPALSIATMIAVYLLRTRSGETLRGFAPAAAVVAVAFFGANYWGHGRLSPPYAQRHASEPGENWYDYEYTARGVTRQSYWRNPQGLDRGEASRATYALHATVGHHGVVSLTPVWVLSLAGGIAWVVRGGGARRWFAIGVLVASAACLVFYLGMRPQADRNYGGSTNGFRWLFWLAPLWAVLLAPSGDWLGRRSWGTAVAGTLLAFSAMSAAYATWNPWSHPWVYQWMKYLGFTVL